jgi:hypothetical protein
MTERADQLHHDNAPAHSTPFVQALLQSITLPTSVSPPTDQIWFPATSGFSQSWNRLWKGDLWIRRSHNTQAQSMASHCRLTSPTGKRVTVHGWTVRSLLTGYQVTSRPREGSRDIQNGRILSGQPSYIHFCAEITKYCKSLMYFCCVSCVMHVITAGVCTLTHVISNKYRQMNLHIIKSPLH